MTAGLTIKQDKFAREYVKDGNGTRAAIKAGYRARSAQQIASENLLKPVVSEAVKALRLRTAERLDVSKDKMVNDVAHIAEQAHIDGEFTAALKGKELIMKAQGYLVERSMNVSVDVTQSHLDALQQYTDQRVTEAVDRAWRKSVEIVEEASAPVVHTTDVDES
jgi:phage terminase small subunit